MKTVRFLFNDEMARAIVEGRKIVTRRPVVPQPEAWPSIGEGLWRGGRRFPSQDGPDPLAPCAPGDLLIGRECHAVERVSYLDNDSAESNGEAEYVYYRATPRVGMRRWLHEGAGPPERMTYLHESTSLDAGPAAKVKAWTPSIHMPDWAARIRRRVVSVTVERLRDISEADAQREGIQDGGCETCGESSFPTPCGCANPRPVYADAFAWVWDSIYAAKGLGWESNCWVWRIEFSAENVG